MESQKLSGRQTMYVGFMLFGMFFGAGNLIFPVFMGQQAGSHVFAATFGFLLTGVGLPLLGVTGIGLTRSKGVFDMAAMVGRPYAYFFTVLLYLIIGPFFATPRLATVSFSVGIAPFTTASWALPVFSILFFAATWWFSSRPSKIMDYIGKFLTPLFLVLLGLLVIVAMVHPLGTLNHPAAGTYANAAILTGFTEGYNTMDALAALAFGVIVVDTIKRLGVKDSGAIAKDTMKAGVLAIVLMGIIYGFLAVIGTMSLGRFSASANGGIILTQVANAYFGSFGNVLLALIVIIACLKTAIGLVTAFGDSMHEMFPKISYAWFVAIAVLLPTLFANVGLTKIIAYSTPVLMFIYPLAITLILLSVFSPVLGRSKWLFGMTTGFTLIASIIDGFNALPAPLNTIGWVHAVAQLGTHLPLFSVGMDWVAPALVGAVIGWLIQQFTHRSSKAEVA